MRKDEDGNVCPGTLGEYRDLCAAIGGADCDAVHWLDAQIAEQGRDIPVLAADSQMRVILMPRLVTKNGKPFSRELRRGSRQTDSEEN